MFLIHKIFINFITSLIKYYFIISYKNLHNKNDKDVQEDSALGEDVDHATNNYGGGDDGDSKDNNHALGGVIKLQGCENVYYYLGFLLI